jgi:hypothetical protein
MTKQGRLDYHQQNSIKTELSVKVLVRELAAACGAFKFMLVNQPASETFLGVYPENFVAR